MVENNIRKLKMDYAPLAKKYKLPDFDGLNRDFEIEKIEKETDYVLRTIRKAMMEKTVNSLGFLEMLMNPVNVPRMYLACVKSLTSEDMKTIDRIYRTFADLILASLEREVNYSEQGEAEMIKLIYNKWAAVKAPFGVILRRLRLSHPVEIKKEKSYFG